MLCLFEQDFLKYYTKAGMDTEELEVGVLTLKGTVQTKKKDNLTEARGTCSDPSDLLTERRDPTPSDKLFFFNILVLQLTGTCHSHDS